MSQNKTICETKPIFLLGKRNENGGISLGAPLVYGGLMADHTIHTSDGSSHPSQLIVSDYKSQTSSLVTGENAPFLSENPNIMVKTGARNQRAGIHFRLNAERVKLLKNKYPTITNSSRMNKFFIQSFSKSGTAPTVAQYSKIMKAIKEKNNFRRFQGSPMEYKRILDYFQFTLVQKLNNSNGKLFLYRPNVHKIQENLTRFTNYKDAIMNSYTSQNENDFLLYNQAYFATKDRPAALASVIRGIKTMFKRSSAVEGRWRSYAFTGNAVNNISRMRAYIKRDVENALLDSGSGEKIKNYIIEYKTDKGNINYFLNYKKFLTLKNSVLKAKVLFYWIFNYPGDNEGKLLQKFISVLDTFHDFTGVRATGSKPTEGGFTNIWPSGSNKHDNSKKFNFSKAEAENILSNKSSFLVKILGRNLYRIAKNDATEIVANVNRRSIGNSKRKLSHLLYFFAIVLAEKKDLTGKCEEYASEILVNTGEIIEKNDFCKFLDIGGKHGLVIDFYSGGGLSCIKQRSAIHGVGIIDPAPRSADTWKEIMLSEARHGCVGRGTKIPVQFDFDVQDENRLIRLHQEYQRQLKEIYNMKGNVSTNSETEPVQRIIAKRSRNNNNNNNTKMVSVKRRDTITPNRVLNRGNNSNSNSNSNNNNNNRQIRVKELRKLLKIDETISIIRESQNKNYIQEKFDKRIRRFEIYGRENLKKYLGFYLKKENPRDLKSRPLVKWDVKKRIAKGELRKVSSLINLLEEAASIILKYA